MGLFDKKFCDICGDKIGLLGNRKLEDGNMCKDCAKKLSPFFSDRKRSTIEEIKQQLAYREQNKQALATFSPMMTLGEYYKIYVDQARGNFVVSRRNPGSWSDENPDVIPLSSIMSCTLRIDEDREEIYMQNSNGDDVSYNPPRYKFTYDFYMDINVNNPYFDEINVKINDNEVEGIGTLEYNRYQQMAQQITSALTPGIPMGSMNMGVNGGMHMNQGYAPANAYGQPNAYAQQASYGQPNAYAQQNSYGQPNAYGQQNAYQQQNPYGQPNAYAQPNPYGQPNAYAQQPMQQPMAQNWICPNCNASNANGNFCACCGSPKNR